MLLAGFQALLHRVTGQEDLLVAVPVSGRTRPETEQVVGFFANTLALRARCDTAPTFAALLAAARESAIAATARQEAPFEQLVDALNPPRSLAYAPLVQVMFALEEPPEPMRAGDVRMTPQLRENGTVKFDLTLTVEDRPEGLRGRLTYRRELFDVARMRDLAEAYRALLAGATGGRTLRSPSCRCWPRRRSSRCCAAATTPGTRWTSRRARSGCTCRAPSRRPARTRSRWAPRRGRR